MSRFFQASEFGQPARHGLPWVPYPPEYYGRLLVLMDALDIIREAWGRPILVLSGYRSPAYNARVGGARHSQHLKGMAADITDAAYRSMAPRLSRVVEGLITDGLIPTVGGIGAYPSFIHIDTRPRKRGRITRW